MDINKGEVMHGNTAGTQRNEGREKDRTKEKYFRQVLSFEDTPSKAYLLPHPPRQR